MKIDYNRIPNYLSKIFLPHRIVTFGEVHYLCALPMCLYIIGDKTYFNETFDLRYIKIEGDYKEILLFNANKRSYQTVVDKNTIPGAIIHQSEIDYLEDQYPEYVEVEYYSDRGWFTFDLEKYVQKIDKNFELNINKFTVSYKGIGKEHFIESLEEWDGWYNDDDKPIFRSVIMLEGFLENFNEQLSTVQKINFESLYLQIQSGDISIDEFKNTLGY